MAAAETSGAVDFLRGMHSRFAQILDAGKDRPQLIDALASQAYELFERNVAIQTQGLQVLACHKGCPACCCLRVTATAPEVFLLADYIRRIDATPAGAQLELPARIAAADAVARDLDQDERMAAKCFCPLIVRDSCLIHPVRPLACRGHAAFDKQACTDAASGRPVDVPLSEPHAVLRSLVQNALQSALRARGYAWRAYELIHALQLALDDPESERRWMCGDDSLAPAVITDTDWQALGGMFDEVVGVAPA